VLNRHERSQAMTQAEYAALLARREAARAAYAALAGQVDKVISVAAPVGFKTTGNPVFVVPGSMLGAPGVSLPVLNDNGLPLGLQVLGFPQSDALLFSAAGWIEDTLRG
jgi:Asp-tRNA(Asn)/Glu-tRNA(Gln) amidotransferase A subunit family amidase